LHLSVRKETTGTAVSTTVVSSNITVHSGATQVVTQVAQTANFGFMRLGFTKIPTSITKHLQSGKSYGMTQERLFWYS